MIKVIFKSEEEKEKLQKARRYGKGLISERAHYVLLSAEGKNVDEIANQTCRHPHTIRSWLKKYLREGIGSFKGRSQSGRPSTKRLKVKQHLEEILATSPEESGFPQSGWFVNLIKEKLNKQLKINASSSTIRRALKDQGLVYKRFAKSVPKHAPSKEEKKIRVEEINKEIMKDEIQEVFFLDESSFSNAPYVQRGWFVKGNKKK